MELDRGYVGPCHAADTRVHGAFMPQLAQWNRTHRVCRTLRNRSFVERFLSGLARAESPTPGGVPVVIKPHFRILGPVEGKVLSVEKRTWVKHRPGAFGMGLIHPTER